MELKHLTCFYTVAECKNVTTAARKLHYSVSTMTQYIQALERELGFELLDRTSRPLELTRAGRFFYEETVGVVRGFERTIEKAQVIAQNQSETIVVGYLPKDLCMVDALKEYFHRRFPDKLLSIRQFAEGDRYEALLSRKYYALLAHTEPEFHHEDLVQVDFLSVCIACRVPEDHPLAGRDMIRFEDLEGETVVIVDTGTFQHQLNFEREFQKLGARITLMSFDQYAAADKVSRSKKYPFLAYEHMFRSNECEGYHVIEFEEKNAYDYSLIMTRKKYEQWD